MRNIAILLAMLMALSFMPTTAVADFYCDGWRYCPSSTYPKGCCVIAGNGRDVIPICIGDAYSCSQECCTGGGCNSYDDYRFCRTGYIANCNVRNDGSAYNLACCSSEYPVWNEGAQRCWKPDWQCTSSYTGGCSSDTPYCVNYQCVECTSNAHCPDDAYCSGNQCLGVECPDDGNRCTNDVVVNHQCTHPWIPGCCNNDADCAGDEVCGDAGVCEPLICVDGDICTVDTAAQHACSYPWTPGCCYDDNQCADTEYCDLAENQCTPVNCDTWTGTCIDDKNITKSFVRDHGCFPEIVESCNETYYCVQGNQTIETACAEIPFDPTIYILIGGAVAGVAALGGGGYYLTRSKGKRRKRK